ncbi:capsule assembly Wzi family protein [Dyadobacter sp. CY107]|uniref:capsule assembly Wzi family protein n=1 Tax=Dyadobacter fanqingshengii TaxID=2906443 RepID=UPI001F1D6133|nr:capsule assembly Wzi family protein [Dyadobacter fanqingshengii]MCF2504710.1 capsule assembly Wzi family protein [Dyadobacter fanqingshengii]
MKKIIATAVLVCAQIAAFSQGSNLKASLEGQTSITSSDHLPFWMRSNQYGSVPLSGPSVSVIGSLYKDYDTTSKRLVDWGAGFQGRANLGKSSKAILVEGYAKARLGIFELKGGRMKEAFGLTDTLLTTGNFAISGNALGIPKVQISIPEFYAVPVFGNFFAFKGMFAQGWLGEKTIQDKRVDHATTYFHQKTVYIRLGKPNWRFKFFGGFTDQVFWGQEAEIFESFILTGWEKYQSVVLGKSWAFSKVGNHAGNIDVRLEYDFDKIRLSAYRQSFYEVGALYHLANIADGINGVSVQNLSSTNDQVFRWRKLVFELLYTKNQAGEAWSKPTPTGDENYLNHYLYKDGWSYYGAGLGTPFVTAAKDARPGQASNSKNYFINNRVSAVHLGMDFSIGRWDILSKISYSKNYGIHRTSSEFIPVKQLSTYLDIKTQLSDKWQIGAVAAFDSGKLLNSSAGATLRLIRSLN